MDKEKPDLSLVGDDEQKAPETVAEEEVQFRAGEIRRKQTEFRLKQENKTKLALEEMKNNTTAFLAFLWRGWHKWVVLGVLAVLLAGSGLLIWRYHIEAEQRAESERQAEAEQRERESEQHEEYLEELLAEAREALLKVTEEEFIDEYMVLEWALANTNDTIIQNDLRIRLLLSLYDEGRFDEMVELGLWIDEHQGEYLTLSQQEILYIRLWQIFLQLGQEERANEYLTKLERVYERMREVYGPCGPDMQFCAVDEM